MSGFLLALCFYFYDCFLFPHPCQENASFILNLLWDFSFFLLFLCVVLAAGHPPKPLLLPSPGICILVAERPSHPPTRPCRNPQPVVGSEERQAQGMAQALTQEEEQVILRNVLCVCMECVRCWGAYMECIRCWGCTQRMVASYVIHMWLQLCSQNKIIECSRTVKHVVLIHVLCPGDHKVIM